MPNSQFAPYIPFIIVYLKMAVCSANFWRLPTKVHSQTTDPTVKIYGKTFIVSAIFRAHCWNACGFLPSGSHYNVANKLEPLKKKDKILYRDNICVALN